MGIIIKANRGQSALAMEHDSTSQKSAAPTYMWSGFATQQVALMTIG